MKKISFTVIILIICFLMVVSCSNKTSSPKNDLENELPDHSEIELDEEFTDEELSDNEMEDSDNGHETPDEESDDDEIFYETPVFRSGFIELEAVDYTFNGAKHSAGKSRIWYNFQPADENPEEKPLFVFFNGGPGASSAILFTYNTSKMTGDQAFSQDGVIENEYSWTQMGNLLYIDARQTGFSYGMIDNPEDGRARSSEYSSSAFNVFIDAADFIRVVLRVLSQNRAIISNPVILVGQSYGGTRVTAMLNILLNVNEYASGKRGYYDEKLFNEIKAHYSYIHSGTSEPAATEMVKKQFSHQILVQPLVAGHDQFNESGKILEQKPGPMYEIEAETGIKFTPCHQYDFQCRPHNNALNYVQKAKRDMYRYRKEFNWLFEYVGVASEKMTDIDTMEKLILNDPREIKWMYAKNREGAFRHPGNTTTLNLAGEGFDNRFIPDSIKTELLYNEQYYRLLSSGNLEETFGQLERYDEYYIGLNSIVTRMFYYFDFSPYSKGNGDMFLENIREVETFITNAEEDIVIYSPGIPPSLLHYDQVENVVENGEEFTVIFKDGTEINIVFPFYSETSHSVSINKPEKFYFDVKKWLGALVPST